MKFSDILGILGFILSLSILLWEVCKQRTKFAIKDGVAQFGFSEIPDMGYLFSFTIVNKASKNLSITSIDLDLEDGEIWSCRLNTQEEIKDFEFGKIPASAYQTSFPMNIPPYSSSRISLLYRTRGMPKSEIIFQNLFKVKSERSAEYQYSNDVKKDDVNNNNTLVLAFIIHTPWRRLTRRIDVKGLRK